MEKGKSWVDYLGSESFWQVFSSIDYVVLAINCLLFLFAGPIIGRLGYSKDDRHYASSVWILRVFTAILFGLYFLAAFFTEYAKPLSITGLTLLCAYLLAHVVQLFLLKRYGRVKEIGDEQVRSHSYQSELFGLLVWATAGVIALLILINIWGLTSWLHATSVLGAVLLIIYSTKDVWAPDNLHGLILLYNGDVEPGSVVKVDELQLLAVVLRTTLSQTVFRDLRSNHKIVLPNSRFRAAKIEILSATSKAGLECFVDFNIAYGITSTEVESFLLRVWQQACETSSSINPEREPRIRVVANGDHAVQWRLIYNVQNVYKILEAEQLMNRMAYECSLQERFGLNTPTTLEVTLQSQHTETQNSE